MVPVDKIVQRLLTQSGITSLVAGLVADHDVRRSKDPNFFDAEANIKLCLAVDDAGELQSFNAPRMASQDVFYVWAFAPDTAAGRTSLRLLPPAVIDALDDWQVFETKQLVTYTHDRLGNQAGALTDSCMDRLTFRCSGIHPGMAT